MSGSEAGPDTPFDADGDLGNLIRHDDREDLMAAVAALTADALRAALAARGKATLAVAGGSTPGPFFDRLAEAELDWARVTIMPTDERLVEPGSPRRNETLIRSRLMTARAAPAQYLSFADPLTLRDPDHGTARLQMAVAEHLPLDLLVLGMGEDLHTASLFPGADRLTMALAEDAPAAMVLRAPGVPEPRVSLTLPVLLGARRRVLLLAGAEKMAALRRAHSPGPVAQGPVRAVLPVTQIHYAP